VIAFRTVALEDITTALKEEGVSGRGRLKQTLQKNRIPAEASHQCRQSFK
jgi:hypothetical protein